MLRVLGRVGSINVRKVVWAADEAGLAYTREDWGQGFQAIEGSEFRMLNPKGLVPVLIDADFILTESNAIMRYLARKAGRDELYPQGTRAQARVDEWLDWQASEFNAAWVYAVQALVRKNPAYSDPDAITASLAAWHKQMMILEHRLEANDAYLLGPFTIADIAIGLSVNRWLKMPLEQPALPAVAAYFARLAARPLSPPYIGAQTD